MSFIEKIKSFFGGSQKEPISKPKTVDAEVASMEPMASFVSWQNILTKELARYAEDKQKYKDYDDMDNEVPEITSALDVTADFTVYPDNINRSKVFKVRSKIAGVQEKIDEIDKRINFQQEFFGMIRGVLKYGDNYEEFIFNQARNKILGFKNIPVETVVVKMKDGMKQEEPMLQQVAPDGSLLASINADEGFHMSLNVDRRRFSATGKGVAKIEKSRLIYRQVRLMEEGVMITRLSRANQNYAVIVDVGDLMGDEALQYLDHYKKRLVRKKYIDSTSGKWSWQYNPLSVVEDILVPTRQGSNANVIPLNNGGKGSNDISDIKHFQDKMIYSTGVPKLLIGKEEDVNAKSTSDVQYVSFLRTIRRIQTVVEPEILRVYYNMLSIEGVKGKLDLYIEWPSLNTIDEERRWRIETMKVQVASTLSKDLALIDDLYIYMNFMGMTEIEAQEMIQRLQDEEDAYSDEMEAQIANAEDLTGQATDEFDTEEKPKKAKEAPAKTGKKEFVNYFRNKLGEVHFEKFTEMMKLVESDPKIKKTLYDLVKLTKIQSGDLS